METIKTAPLTVELAVLGERVKITMDVPLSDVRLDQLLPALQVAADGIVGAAVHVAEKEGRKVSCAKGCAACCRQLIPVAPAEARRIARIVAELPEERRAVVEKRFADARERLAEAGLLPRLLVPEEWGEGEARSLGLRHFRLWIACPFLEDESCSIYPDRPIACREYLVSSPAANCTEPDRYGVVPVKGPVRVWAAVSQAEGAVTGAKVPKVPWVPLILAPGWAAENTDLSVPRRGPDLLRQVFGLLARLPEGP